jgi:hypothetical protein
MTEYLLVHCWVTGVLLGHLLGHRRALTGSPGFLKCSPKLRLIVKVDWLGTGGANAYH